MFSVTGNDVKLAMNAQVGVTDTEVQFDIGLETDMLASPISVGQSGTISLKDMLIYLDGDSKSLILEDIALPFESEDFELPDTVKYDEETVRKVLNPYFNLLLDEVKDIESGKSPLYSRADQQCYTVSIDGAWIDSLINKIEADKNFAKELPELYDSVCSMVEQLNASVEEEMATHCNLMFDEDGFPLLVDDIDTIGDIIDSIAITYIVEDNDFVGTDIGITTTVANETNEWHMGYNLPVEDNKVKGVAYVYTGENAEVKVQLNFTLKTADAFKKLGVCDLSGSLIFSDENGVSASFDIDGKIDIKQLKDNKFVGSLKLVGDEEFAGNVITLKGKKSDKYNNDINVVWSSDDVKMISADVSWTLINKEIKPSNKEGYKKLTADDSIETYVNTNILTG